MHDFTNVSLLITHYNRSKSLEKLIESFFSLNCKFGEIVVSDDGSELEHYSYVQRLVTKYQLRLLTTPCNKGLAHNINKGQRAVTCPYTLYVQEDFVPSRLFPERLRDSLSFLEEDKALDIVKFYAYFSYPYLQPFKNDFSKICFNRFAWKYTKIYCYTDHPHLRRSTFLDKFGRYDESLKGDKMEYKMCLSFIKNKGQGLFYNDFTSLFEQKNSCEEPSTMTREGWRQSKNLIIVLIRNVYRQLKYNFDILMTLKS